MIEPEVLLLDEPLSNLREEMRSEIHRLRDAFRITTFYVTHDQSEAMVTSDRIVVINRRRIEQVDDPVSLYRRPKTRFVAGFIGRTNLLDGRRDGDRLVFPGFTVAAGDLAGASFSVRPQTIVLHETDPTSCDGRLVGWRVRWRSALISANTGSVSSGSLTRIRGCGSGQRRPRHTRSTGPCGWRSIRTELPPSLDRRT